jgi:hypothetical protein
MQLHRSFQDLQQGDASVTTYMQHAKSLFDELAAVGRPLSLEDFNLYIFCGLHGEFKDLVTSLVTKAKPLSYADIHSHLLTHEFLHKSSLLSLATNPPLLPTPSLLSSVHLAQQQTSFNFGRNRGRSRRSWRSNNNRYSSHDRSDFRGSHSSAPTDWKQSHWQQPRRPAAGGQWPPQRSFEQHVKCQLCFSFSHIAPQCAQFLLSSTSMFIMLLYFFARMRAIYKFPKETSRF